VITRIGLKLFGTDFARLESPDRQTVVEQALAEHRMLLVTTRSHSSGLPPPSRSWRSPPRARHPTANSKSNSETLY
jgi:hypothetical protein